MNKIRIAIISDLHCMYGKTTPMKTLLYSEDLIRPINQHPVEALKELIKNENIECDYVICPGDLTNEMCPQGIKSGFGYIENLKQKLNASMSFYTPGNHDIDSRSKIDSNYTTEPLRTLIAEYPLKADDSLLNEFWANGFCIYTDEAKKADILLIDSTFTHENKDKAAQSIIPPDLLERLDLSLRTRLSTSLMRIAVCHHSPIKISNIDSKEYKDLDVIENGDKLIQTLINNNYNLLIHGHKHVPYLKIYDSLPILSAGSFSAVANIIESGSNNTFHIVELCADNKNCFGTILTWIFKRGIGWKRDTDPDSMLPTITGFGSSDIHAQEISAWIEEQKTDRIKYAELKNTFPNIEFLTPNQQRKLIQELKDQYNLAFSPQLTLGPTEIAKIIN